VWKAIVEVFAGVVGQLMAKAFLGLVLLPIAGAFFGLFAVLPRKRK
jgi:hypothetical protein